MKKVTKIVLVLVIAVVVVLIGLLGIHFYISGGQLPLQSCYNCHTW